MISRLLPALKKFLAAECANLHLVSPEKGKDGKEILRAPRVFIGDFPAKREHGQDTHDFPCILLAPEAGYAEDKMEIIEMALILAVYNSEKGDAEGLEMDIALLYSTVSRALRKCLDIPIEESFNLVRDEKGRAFRWQRRGEPDSPRPFAQMVMIGRFTAYNWE